MKKNDYLRLGAVFLVLIMAGYFLYSLIQQYRKRAKDLIDLRNTQLTRLSIRLKINLAIKADCDKKAKMAAKTLCTMIICTLVILQLYTPQIENWSAFTYFNTHSNLFSLLLCGTSLLAVKKIFDWTLFFTYTEQWFQGYFYRKAGFDPRVLDEISFKMGRLEREVSCLITTANLINPHQMRRENEYINKHQ